MSKIFDCFLFFNEFDLLEIRLHELSEVVDNFVIAEASTTFSGLPKPLHFQKNKQRFAAFEDRIIHIVIDTSLEPGASAWRRQQLQRDALVSGLEDAEDDDIVLLSDVDEICSRETVRALRATPPRRGEVFCFELRMFNYFLNAECGVRWLRSGPRAVRKSDLVTMERLRKVCGPARGWPQDVGRAVRAWREMGRPVRRRLIPDAGWHFSYLGGIDAIHEKMRSFAGYDRVPDNIKDSAQLAEKIAAASPISYSKHGLRYREVDGSFPIHVQQNREKFSHLLADPSKTAAKTEPPQ